METHTGSAHPAPPLALALEADLPCELRLQEGGRGPGPHAGDGRVDRRNPEVDRRSDDGPERDVAGESPQECDGESRPPERDRVGEPDGKGARRRERPDAVEEGDLLG